MRVSTKRILSIGLAALFIIGALVTYLNFIQPEGKIINEKRALIRAKELALKNQKAVVDDVQKLIAQFQNVVGLKENISFAMPPREESISALRQIEAIARASSVMLSSISFKPSTARSVVQLFTKKLGTLEINMMVSGTYENLKQFLSFLETSVRVTNIKDFQFTPNSGKTANNPGALDTLRVTVEVYYQEG